MRAFLFPQVSSQTNFVRIHSNLLIIFRYANSNQNWFSA